MDDKGVEAATAVDTRDGGAVPASTDDGPTRGRGRRRRLRRRWQTTTADRPRGATPAAPPRARCSPSGSLLAVAGAGWPGLALVVAVLVAVLVRSVGLDVLAVQ